MCIRDSSPTVREIQEVVVKGDALPGVYQVRLGVLARHTDIAKMPPLQLGTSSNLRPPKKLYALGFPAGMEFGDTPTPTEGSFAGKLDDDHGQWLKFQGMISGGHSGGPVITTDGKVVAWNVRNNIHVTLERDEFPELQGDVRVEVPVRGISGLNHVRPIEFARACYETAVLSLELRLSEQLESSELEIIP